MDEPERVMSPDPVPYPPPVGVRLPPPPAPAETDSLARLSPQQVLLGAGAVAVVAAGATSLDGAGWALRTGLALAAAAASVVCGRRRLRTSEETLASASVVLVVIGVRTADPRISATVFGVLAALFLGLGQLGRTAVTWPIGSWCAAQLAVLAVLRGLRLPPSVHVAVVLGTALAGLLVTLGARRRVAVVVLATSMPWWVAGTVQGGHLAWTTPSVGTAGAEALLMVSAAAALLALWWRPELRPLLGPRPLAPVLSGAVTGAACAGLLQATGPAGVPAAGYLGLVVAALVAELASPAPHSVVRPAGLALAGTATALAVTRLLADGRLTALALLLLAAAVPAVLVAARQPADRPGAIPVAVGCLAGAALLAEIDGTVGHGRAGVLLITLAVVALVAATLERHQSSEVPLAVSAVLVGVIGVAHVGRTGDASALAVALGVLAAALIGYADRTGRNPARAAGCAGLATAAWLAVGDAGVRVPEAYTLPLAAVLLLYSGRRLATAPSWSSWGPALVVGYGPSVLLALVEPGLLRVIVVVVAATATTIAATDWAVRAPFEMGAGVLVTVAVGRLALVLPVPGLVAVVLAGVVLLAVGAAYENRRRHARDAVPSVADMR